MFGLGNITKSVNLSLSQNNGLGKPTVKFEFEDNNSLFDFFVKTNKASTEYAQNVEFEDVQDFEKTNNKKKNISTSTLLYLPNSTDKEDNTKTTNPKSLPPSGPEKKKNKTTNPKALPPSSTPNLPNLKSVLKPEGVYINHRKIGDYGYINDNLKYINLYIDKEYMVNDNIFKWSERIFPHAVIIICFQDSNGIWKFFFQRPKYKDFIYKKFPNSFIQNSGIKYFIFDLQHIEKVIQAFESEGFPVVLIHRNIVEDINDLSTQTNTKALPPSGIETDATFIPFGYEKITDEKVIQRFNEYRNILNNSGLIPVSDIISVIEKKPSVIFTTAGTDGIKKYKFKGKEDDEFVFEAVNDNGEPIPGEINLKFYHNGIERLNALKSWFINPESTSKTSDVKTETTTSKEPNWSGYEKRFADASHWSSFDPERSARVNVAGYKGLYDKYASQVDSSKIDAFNKYFDNLLNEVIAARSHTANLAVTGGGGISASKARKLNAASDRYMEKAANFESEISDFVKKLNRSTRRAEFVQMSNEERSDERFNELKKGIDFMVASKDLLKKIKKDKSIIPTVKDYKTYLRIYGTPEMAEAETLRMTQYNITLDKSGLYDKILREYNNGNYLTVNRVLDYLKDKDLFTDKHKVWNLRKKIEKQPDFVSVDNSKKIFEGAEVLENRELDRIQIKFDGIPSEDCRNDLKSNGFRWSPYYKVWQRKLTPQAVSMAYRIVEKYYKEISLGKPTIKFEFENNDDIFKMFETPGLSGNMFAVFNCPISDLKCLGFSPTYKKLSSYDSLVDTPQGGKTLMGYGFETATLTELNNACKYYKQVEKLAKHLKGDSPLQSAFNVWYFLHENIIYNYDTEGQEEIRTPARSWADRLTGIDCDCLAVLTACLLFNMGYKPKFEIVGFNNNNCYSHIFVNLDGLAIDRVLPTFLKRPDGITNTKIMEIPVFELNGGDELINDCLLNGIYQSTLKKVVDNANSNDIINLRKIELLNNLQNSDTNAFKLASILMPYVSLIDDDGNFYFTDSVIADSAELADNRLYELYTSGASDSEKENFLKQFVSAFREIQIEVESGNKPFVNVKIQNVFSKPFTVEGNMIEKKLITLNPNFNRIKEAILFLLSVNYADLAKKIAVGLLPLDRVVNNGYNEEKWENAKIANAKLFEFWRLIGGDTALLIENIKDGYYNNLSGCKTLSGVDSIDETITTDIAVERIGNFFTVILDWYKDIEPLNIIQNNDNHIVNSVSADSNSLEDNSLLSSNAFIAEQPKISVNNPGLWIVAAAALGLSAVALSKNKK